MSLIIQDINGKNGIHTNNFGDDIYSICYYDDIGRDVSYVLNDNNKYIYSKCNEIIIKCCCDPNNIIKYCSKIFLKT